ncbi:putative metacaspase type I, plant [Helianthus anomalus]
MEAQNESQENDGSNREPSPDLVELDVERERERALSKVTSTGAMTFSFIQAIERGHATTYGDMLTSMRTTIRNNESDMGGGAVMSLLGMLLTGGSLGGGIRQVSSSLLEIFLFHYCARQNEWVGLTHKHIPLLIENLVD